MVMSVPPAHGAGTISSTSGCSRGAGTWGTDSKGKLRTTTKATADGYFRYAFDGMSTTPAITSAGDYIDVK